MLLPLFCRCTLSPPLTCTLNNAMSPCVLPCSEPWKVPQEGRLLCLRGGQQQWEPVSRAAPQWRVPGLGLPFIWGCGQHRLLLLTCTYKPTAGRYKTPVYPPSNQQTRSMLFIHLYFSYNYYFSYTLLFHFSRPGFFFGLTCFGRASSKNPRKTLFLKKQQK